MAPRPAGAWRLARKYAVAAVCDRRKIATDIVRSYETAAYSLIEVLVAAAILMLAIGAAAAMSLAVTAQQDANARVARALNYQEQAARLYQLGIEADAVTALLPPESALVSLEFANETTVTVSNIGVIERADCVAVFKPGSATEAWASGTWNPGSATALRTNSMVVVRPTIR